MITDKFKNYTKLISMSIIIMLVIGTVSCTDDFSALNTPEDKLVENELNKDNIGQAFSHAQYYVPTYGWFQVMSNLHADTWTQYFSQIHPEFDTGMFIEEGVWSSTTFRRFYEGMKEMKLVLDYTSENNLEVENAIANVQRVILYQRHTDMWGPIIYSEFGSGETQVSYDSQEFIYKDFFKKLDQAVDVLSQNTDSFGFADHDMMHGGDAGKWLITANSLRLRLAMRISYVEPDLAQQEAEKAITALGGVMTENSDNALLTNTVETPDPLSTITYHVEWGMSSTMDSFLNGYNDPRISEYFQQCCARFGDKTNSGYYDGIRNGLPTVEKGIHFEETISYLGSEYLQLIDGGENPPTAFLTAAEVYFLRAEGALRGWGMGGGTAEEYYDDGIRTSIEFETNATDEEITEYINSTNTPVEPGDRWDAPPVADIPVDYQTGADFETQLEQIITQKWIAGYPHNGHNTFAERRRTGYPRGYAIIESLNPELSETDLFRRLAFTEEEITSNGNAVEEAREYLKGPDNNATRVWWDAKPIEDFPTPRGYVDY